MIQSQSQFGSGLNRLLPRHRVPDGASVDIVDADVFDGTLKPMPSFGGEGGGQVYYYEAGNSWVGSSGFAVNQGSDQLIVNTADVSSNEHVDVNGEQTFISPLIVERGFTYTVEEGHEITVISSIKGLFNANSFVEYNQDLYVGRDSYFITISGIANNYDLGVCTLTLEPGQIDRVHEGDTIEPNDLIPNFTEIVSILYEQDQVVINNNLATDSTVTVLAMNATPIRIVDGNLNNTYPLGLEPPEPDFDFQQISDNNLRVNSHTTLWYSTPSAFYPIPYQYGLSRYDLPTGAESGMSALSDPSLSAQFLLKTSDSIHRPLRVDVSNVEQGLYALYRTGGTSSVIKRVAVLLLGYSTNVLASVSGDQVTVTLSNLPQGRYRLNLYNYGGAYYDYVSSFVEDEDNDGTVVFTFTRTDGTAHFVDIFAEVELLADPFKRVGVIGVASIEDGTVIEGGAVGNQMQFLDFTPPQALIDIQPILSSNLPPTNMSFLTEVNNFFFGVNGRVLYISRFADPNNWPLDGYITFDNTITALSKRGSDLLVFTTFNLFRVYGSSPESMRKTKIPTVDGVASGLAKTVQQIGNGVVYLSPNGLMYFNGAEVRNLTKELVGVLKPPAVNYVRNVAGVVDDQYYLLSPDSDGYILDLRQGVRLTRSSLRATNLHYRGNTNLLYNESGYLGGGDLLGYDVLTRSFDGGDRTKLKLYRNFALVGEDFEGSGQIRFLVDGVVAYSTPAPTATLLGRTFRLPTPVVGLEAQVELINVKGRTMRIDVEMDLLGEQYLRRWNHMELQYCGTLTIDFTVDGLLVVDGYVLPDTAGETQTAQIFFPPMTEGEIGHLYCEETEANKLLRISYDTEDL